MSSSEPVTPTGTIRTTATGPCGGRSSAANRRAAGVVGTLGHSQHAPRHRTASVARAAARTHRSTVRNRRRNRAGGDVSDVGRRGAGRGPDGVYELVGRLRERQRRQDRSRHPEPRAWNGWWRLAVVVAEGRSADERTELRSAMRVLRFAELREGVWLRPDNIELDPTAAAVADAQCTWFRSETDESLAADELFEVESWKRRALDLSIAMSDVANDLERGSTDALVPGFILDAAVLRHFLADPLLPGELLPFDWPGQTLRDDYERLRRCL